MSQVHRGTTAPEAKSVEGIVKCCLDNHLKEETWFVLGLFEHSYFGWSLQYVDGGYLF